MPIVPVFKEELDARLGRVYTEDEFRELCFDFGVELDDVTSEKEMIAREQNTTVAEGVDDRLIYKIDVPANRYDLLCLEGLTRALSIFTKNQSPPVYQLTNPDSMLSITVTKNPAQVRPFIVSAVLRDVSFTKSSWNSFLNLQDKLHQNICRKRTLVAIGTHDLDSLTPPFRYDARAPKDIVFRPLSQDKEFAADELMEFYETDATVKHIKPYVKIIKDSPVYPVIYDANDTVLSLPPIINGEHSKMSQHTKNVLIESTATDLTKAHVVLNTMVAMFSEYCAKPFTVEPVQINYEDGTSYVTPDISTRMASADIVDINSILGVTLAPNDICTLLDRMQLAATYNEVANKVDVTVPITRSDVLHACDIIEDVAIAFGYNNVPIKLPSGATVGRQQPMNHLTDLLRLEMAAAGYTESLTMALVSKAENFDFMCKANDGTTAAVIANPKTQDFQIVRTSLLPGLLKTLNANKMAGIKDGVKVFEISDVVLMDSSMDVGARNQRNLAAMYTGPTAGFDIIHGMLDRVLGKLGLVSMARIKEEAAMGIGTNAGGAGAGAGAGAATAGVDEEEEEEVAAPARSAAAMAKEHPRYYLRSVTDASYFPGRAGEVVVLQPSEADDATGTVAGIFGTLHPTVLQNFKLTYPVSSLELNLEVLI